jgi:hypothetical protein
MLKAALRRGLRGLIAAAVAVPGVAFAQAAGADGQAPGTQASFRLQTDFEGLARDGGEYARRHGVTLVEAVQRLRAQEESVAATDAIAKEFQGRIAGISLEHRPALRIVVMLTGAEPVAERSVRAGGIDVPILFRTGAGATREQVTAAIREHQAAIRASLKAPPGMGLDPRTGEMVLVVHATDLAREGVDALDLRMEALTGVPVRIRPQGLEERDAVAGGARLEGPKLRNGERATCTAGFVVTDGARTGIATAAHCPDVLSYSDPENGALPLSFVGQWGWGFRDVQIHASELAQRPLFYADADKGAARTLVTWRNRASTRGGDVVCHRGETSGYSCSEVELIDYAPPGDLCGGPCAPAWTTVAGPSCKGGDSGGPVFVGSTAFGLLKGASYARSGRCDFYYYMSTDYLPEGWRLLH